MRIAQQQKLAPRMIQSMEILQLSSQALEERIEQELSDNPTLELAGPDEPDESEKRERDAALEQEKRDAKEGERELDLADDAQDPGHSADFERMSNAAESDAEGWSNSFESEGYRPAPRSDGERDAKMDAMANTASRAQSLGEQLLDQWRVVETTPALRRAGEHLIGFIDEDGYLRSEMPDLLRQAPPGLNADLLEEAIDLLQRTLEPPGLAARDLRECLLLQIDHALDDPEGEGLSEERRELLVLAAQIVGYHIKDLERNRLPQIAKAQGTTVERVKLAVAQLRQMRPHPGRELVSEAPRRIRPDAVVEFDEGEDRYVARLTSDRLPGLQISHRYEKMARDKSLDRKTRQFVGNNLRSASWLLDAIRQRDHTLMRVINVVIEAQREYLDLGPQHLRPLPMTQVADQLGIHVATVSRAVNEKYIETPRGIVPLRMFFSGGTETESGEAMSWQAVQAKLEEVIAAEDKSDPLNDDQLVDRMKALGIEIARRTIAKYRSQLNIPPARQRKQY